MKARPWSRITHIGGPDNPASFPPHAETQARRLLHAYRAPVDPALASDAAAVDGSSATNGSAIAASRDAPTGDEPWDALIASAGASYASPEFVEREVNRTLRISEALRRTRGALLAALRARARAATAPAQHPGASQTNPPSKRGVRPHAWPALLARATAMEVEAAPAAGKPAGPHAGSIRIDEEPPAVLARFADWCVAHPDAGEACLAALWTGADRARPDAPGERISAFLAGVPASVATTTAARLRLASWLLLALDPTRYPVYDEALFLAGYALARQTAPPADAAEGELYEQALALLDRVADEATRRGVPLRHRLHARGVLERGAAQWAEGRVPQRKVAEALTPFGEQRGLAALADDLLLDGSELEKIHRLLADKGQCILYGPPGTGKTYVARRLAAWLAGDEARVETVQFHPSYAYEDFVEGYRPQLIDGRPGFALVDGPLKRLARAAALDPQHLYLLVIDELNRGNVAKVFGELYFLLEYRGQTITLQYSGASFSLPPNLWLIGTMNTADRSIALVDLALRRRFYFVPFFPDQPPVAGLLHRWLTRHQPHLTWLAAVVDEANRLLADRDAAIGPSYFLRQDLDEGWIPLIWEHAVLPYVVEQLAGDEDALANFALDRLRARVAPAPPTEYRSRKRKGVSGQT